MSDLPSVNTTYEPFSQEPEYIETNRRFVARQSLRHVRRFLDLACGTGLVSELLLAASPEASLNGVDYDPVQIELATDHLRGLGYQVEHGFQLAETTTDGNQSVILGVGSADELPFPDASFDCVTIANAIHVLPDKRKLLAEVSRVLKPGGLFGFNSAFYAGTMPPGTERWYTDWLKEAICYIDRENERRKAAGEEPIKRKRGTTRKAFQNRWYSPQEWSELLAEFGMKTHVVEETAVTMDQRCMKAVGAYGGLAEVLLSGYPVEAASLALQAAVEPAFEAFGTTSIPKNWLDVWATRA